MVPLSFTVLLLLVIAYFGPSISLPLQQSSKSRSHESGLQSRTRRQSMNVEVIAHDIPKAMENEVIKLIEEVMTKYGSNLSGVNEIGKKMDAKYGPYWQVFSYPAGANTGSARHAKQHILLEINEETRILMYQADDGKLGF